MSGKPKIDIIYFSRFMGFLGNKEVIIEILEKPRYKNIEEASFLYLGCYYNKGKSDKTLEKIEEILVGGKNENVLLLSHYSKGMTNFSLGNYSEVENSIMKIESLLKCSTLKIKYFFLHLLIAKKYQMNKNHKMVLEYLKKCKEDINNLPKVEVLYIELFTSKVNEEFGYYYRDIGDFDKSMDYFTNQLEISKLLYGENSFDYSNKLFRIGMIKWKVGDCDAALEYFNKTIQICKI